MVPHRVRRAVRSVGVYLGVAAFAAFALIPVFWMVSTSVRPLHHIYASPPIWISPESSLQPYVDVWASRPFMLYIKNTLAVSVSATLIAMVFANFAAYGFSRFRFRGSHALLALILATQMFPLILIVIPYFRMMVALDLIDKPVGLIIAYVSFTLPFTIWSLKGFYDSVPRDLDDAALIDGCSRTQAFLRVIMPLSRPGLATTAIFAALTAWNHYLFALVLLITPDKQVLSVAIPSLMSQYQIHWNQLMAAATIAVIPPVVLYSLLERFLVQGLTSGAVKG